jgi:hypothetical protein
MSERSRDRVRKQETERSRRATTRSDPRRAMREQRAKINACTPTSWRICFAGARR